MAMKRYKEIDMLRAVAVILVALYHFWVVSGYKTTGIDTLNIFLSYGGEIGVTLFFLISGFGICCNLQHGKEKGQVSFKNFIGRRLQRIYPQYFLSIAVAVLVGDGAVYLAKEHLPSIVSHLFLVHNFSPVTHGSISGVLWTMGVIFDFYLVSIVLFKGVDKNWVLMALVSVLVAITSKALIYHFLSEKGLSESYYFIYGRQIITALDNFVIGMCIARMKLPRKKKENILKFIMSVVVFAAWIVYVSPNYSLYSDTLFGYIWHSVTAILLGVCVYFMLGVDWRENFFSNSLLFVGRYEYGIYLWHLLIANNLSAKSGFVQKIINRGYWEFALMLFVISVIVGRMSNEFIWPREVFKSQE